MFSWDDNNFNLEHVKEELADVINYSIQLSQVLNLDLIDIVNSKMDKNEKKYPIEKAKGAISGATKEKTYEGYGSGNVAVIVECLTDNDNRTFAEVRTCFNKTGGQIGTSVDYLFNRKAIFKFTGLTEDEAMEVLMNNDCDCEEIKSEDDLTVISADPKEYNSIKTALENCGKELDFDTNEITLIPMNKVDLDEEHEEKFRRMLDMLRELDDVQEIYHNANIEEDEE